MDIFSYPYLHCKEGLNGGNMVKSRIQLQSILMPAKEVCEVSELYYHQNGSRVDFDGYFNLFYVEKRKKYTSIQDLELSIEIQGYHSLLIVHDGKDLETISLEAEICQSYKIPFPYDAYKDGVFWFALLEDGVTERQERKVSGFYTAQSWTEYRDINIGVNICTFRREIYVERNLRQLMRQIFDQEQLDVSRHVAVYVIDNGKTLQDYEPVQMLVKEAGNAIRIIPNKNVGGAGGFTRGMLEIMYERKHQKFTHVLMMDDDAVLEPDSLVRIYGFLFTAKKAWKDITVGGIMLREDYPYMLFCAGEWWENGTIQNPGMHRDLRTREEAVSPYLTEASHEHDKYSGWWLCCCSLNMVREDNLPIPLFIHYDDIEFGIRNSDFGVVFLNGVGVWHKGFDMNFPGTNVYYDIRNQLIEIALRQGHRGRRTAAKLLIKTLIVATIRLKYRDVRIAYQGWKDFRKGPDWLYWQDPEKLNTKIRGMLYKMEPLEILKEGLSSKECQAIENQIQNYEDTLDIEKIIAVRSRKKEVPLWQFLTFNGWFLTSDGSDIKVIFPLHSPFDTFRKKKVLLYDPDNGKGALLERKYGELVKCIGIYIKTLIEIFLHYNRAADDYKNNIGKFTNAEAWEAYLKR